MTTIYRTDGTDLDGLSVPSGFVAKTRKVLVKRKEVHPTSRFFTPKFSTNILGKNDISHVNTVTDYYEEEVYMEREPYTEELPTTLAAATEKKNARGLQSSEVYNSGIYDPVFAKNRLTRADYAKAKYFAGIDTDRVYFFGKTYKYNYGLDDAERFDHDLFCYTQIDTGRLYNGAPRMVFPVLFNYMNAPMILRFRVSDGMLWFNDGMLWFNADGGSGYGRQIVTIVPTDVED